ncbi:MAG: hypothetical protein ACFFA4_01295 [Promethearchaeota archaeon]
MNEKNPNNKSSNVNVFIKKEAFRNMLTHVLRFGSEVLENSVEVMGMCLGKFDLTDNKIIVDNAIPIMHGTPVSIGFSKKEVDLIQQIENQYKKTIVGWYLSRPGWGLDFTEITIANHQYFQNEKFPQGFCIIFDHTLIGLDGNFGFEIFQLNNYTKTEKYTSLSCEIEIPSTLEYFKWIQKFMEDFNKKNPILIKEVNEIVDQVPGDLQEIPNTEITEQIVEELGKHTELTSIISGFKQGSDKFSQIFMETFQHQLGDWINDIEQGNTRGIEYITKSVDKMKQAVVAGLLKGSGWFKKTLNESLYEFKNSIYKYVEKRIEEQQQITEEISNGKENLVNNLKNLIGGKIENIDSEIVNLTTSLDQKFDETSQINIKMEDLIKKLENNLLTINNQTNLFTQEIEKKVESSLEPLQTNINEKTEKLSGELDPFRNNYSEIRTFLDKLQKIITEFRNLT